MDRDDKQPLGRVPVARTIRLCAAPSPEAAGAVRQSADLTCARCGAVLCEASRRSLFSGMVLRCAGCGEPHHVARAG